MEQVQSRYSMMLRCHVEVSTEQEAVNLLGGIENQINDLATIERFKIEQYWKIPQYYVITMHLQAKGKPQAAISKLLESGKDGWSIISQEPDWSAVWNPRNGAMLLAAEVRWANIQYWYR